MVLIHLEWHSSTFDGPNAFFPQIQQAPGPNFKKVEKSLNWYDKGWMDGSF